LKSGAQQLRSGAQQPKSGVRLPGSTGEAFTGICRTVVTDADLANMNIPPIDKTRTPIGKPPTRPVFYIMVKDTRLLLIHFQDQDTESKAIPYGMNGAVISWGIFDTPPSGPEALTHTELATRTPHPLHFAEADRGKTVYIALQWQNESGIRGESTEMQSAIIP
jgi:hypothetical protein